METRYLETFLKVVEHGSFAEASRRLGVTPAAVAQRIETLEEEIGLQLVSRAGRKVRATSAGNAILARSRQLLVDVRHLRIAAAEDLPSGELRLGSISTALTGLLAPALGQLRETVPAAEVFVLPGTSTELYQQLVDGHIDAALIVEPPFAIMKSLHWKLLRSEPTIMLAPRAWAADGIFTLLATRPFIRYDRNNWGGRVVDRFLHEASIAPRDWLELDSLEAISVMVANGLGVALVPEWASPWPESNNVVRLTLPLPTEPRRLGMLWRRNATTQKLVTILLESLSKYAKKSP